jgi:hypothetical protein
VVGNPKLVAVSQYSVAGTEAPVLALLDHPGQVDARDQRIAPDHPSVSPDGQPVLVVDRRILDPDRHLAGHQPINRPLLQIERDAVAGFVHDHGAKRAHG